MKVVNMLKRGVGSLHSRYLAACVGLTVPLLAWADSTGKLQGFEDASGKASGKKLDNLANNVETTSGAVYNAFTVVCTLLGVLVVGISLFQFYKASKEERESPKSAVVGLLIGGGMTAVGVIAAMSANTLVGTN